VPQYLQHISQTQQKNENHEHEQKARSQNLINIQEKYQIPTLDHEHSDDQ
jgi:hypothetical protein